MASNRLLLLVILGLGFVLSACIGGNDDDPIPGAVTWENDEGAVTVKVTWGGLAAGPEFEVALDTHSVELDGYDLTDLAVLRAENGTELTALAWDAPKGGHHRSGKLAFPASIGGMPTFSDKTSTFQLVIRDIDGVKERAFTWTAEREAEQSP